jgi:DNA-binding transcriptional ArsR family regulator
MTHLLELGVADLAGTRFATSPLAETVRAVLLLGNPARPAVNRPWLDWARSRLDESPLRLARTWPLVVNGLDWFPEFMIPAPGGQRPSFGEELARFRAAPDEAVRGSLGRVFENEQWPDSAKDLFADPARSLEEIADELACCYERLIAPHWGRVQSVLDADIAYRSGLLARGGARALFGDMHPDVHWSAGLLSINDGTDQVFRARLGPGGIVLMPSVFNWPYVSSSLATSTQTILQYPARGVATVWHALSDALPARLSGLSELIGVTRARLLDTLRSPATTSALAGQFGVTPGAVSQHLAALHRGGLLTKQRSRHSVLYQTSELGLALLAVDPRLPGCRHVGDNAGDVVRSADVHGELDQVAGRLVRVADGQ